MGHRKWKYKCNVPRISGVPRESITSTIAELYRTKQLRAFYRISRCDAITSALLATRAAKEKSAAWHELESEQQARFILSQDLRRFRKSAGYLGPGPQHRSTEQPSREY